MFWIRAWRRVRVKKFAVFFSHTTKTVYVEISFSTATQGLSMGAFDFYRADGCRFAKASYARFDARSARGESQWNVTALNDVGNALKFVFEISIRKTFRALRDFRVLVATVLLNRLFYCPIVSFGAVLNRGSTRISRKRMTSSKAT